MNQPLNQLESLGRYKLIRELGRGGMSVVYLAKDTELGREVAIKCVDTSVQVTAKLAERLRSEAKLLAQLNHSNIVQLYDVIEQGNILGLVIEYIGGDTLTQRLKQAPSKEVKLKWLAEVAEGLASAHKKGIAHCDLKTDNVLITHDNIAKVADFGIAKVKLDDYLEDDGLTRIDSVSGSYFSLSPEQATGEAVDTRTDLFSLAVLVFQTLIGKHPFGDTHNKVALLQRVISTPLEIEAISKRTLGARLAELIENLLSKNPDDRLYNAEEVAELLKSPVSRPQQPIDQTQEIPIRANSNNTQTPEQKKGYRWLMPSLMLIAGFTIGAIVLKLTTTVAPEQKLGRYIALDDIMATSSDEANSEQNRLISTTIRHSAENAILSLPNVGLVTAQDLNSTPGNLQKKALAAGVDQVLRIMVDCNISNCDVAIEQRSGAKMAVTAKKNFVVANSAATLYDLEKEIARQSADMLTGLALPKTSLNIASEDFTDYLNIYQQSKGGTASTLEHHAQIQKFIAKYPSYLPAYTLAYQVANHLRLNTGNLSPITKLKSLIESAPLKVRGSLRLKAYLCFIAIVSGDISSAQLQLNDLKTVTDDAVTISTLESALAYVKNDFDTLLELDRKNVQLRPSALNHYNLATSEYSIGNLEAAKFHVNATLALLPSDAYAKDLKGSIALSQGELDEAAAIYKHLISEHDDENYYANYGLTLLLKSDYTQAIASLTKVSLH